MTDFSLFEVSGDTPYDRWLAKTNPPSERPPGRVTQAMLQATFRIMARWTYALSEDELDELKAELATHLGPACALPLSRSITHARIMADHTRSWSQVIDNVWIPAVRLTPGRPDRSCDLYTCDRRLRWIVLALVAFACRRAGLTIEQTLSFTEHL